MIFGKLVPEERLRVRMDLGNVHILANPFLDR